jgi:hypothetical protein
LLQWPTPETPLCLIHFLALAAHHQNDILIHLMHNLSNYLNLCNISGYGTVKKTKRRMAIDTAFRIYEIKK